MDKLTAEKSRKIATFMGAVALAEYKGEKGGYFDSVLFDFGKEYPDNHGRYYSDISMKYHKDWNWLMPVVQKLISFGYYEHLNNSFNTYGIDNLFNKTYDLIILYNRLKDL